MLTLVQSTGYSPGHDLKVRYVFLGGLYYFAGHTEESRCFVKRLFTVPTAQSGQTCTVIPVCFGLINVVSQSSVLQQWSAVPITVPCVLSGEAS